MLWLSVVGGVAFIGGLVGMFATEKPEYGHLALIGLAAFAVARAFVFGLSRSLVCPLCHGTVMHEKRCQKHGQAARWSFLSYRATAAASVLCHFAFRCMYCGTAYRLKK